MSNFKPLKHFCYRGIKLSIDIHRSGKSGIIVTDSGNEIYHFVRWHPRPRWWLLEGGLKWAIQEMQEVIDRYFEDQRSAESAIESAASQVESFDANLRAVEEVEALLQ